MAIPVKEQTEPPAVFQAATAKLQIQVILCPVDFSEFSTRALRYAIRLARHFGARLLVQHTAQPNYLMMAGVEGNTVGIDLETQIQAARQDMRRLLSATGIDTAEVAVILNDGIAADQILQTVLKERVDLIVMGTHGHRGINHLVLGSVAEQIIHRSNCPVLVVNRPVREFPAPGQPDAATSILLATDFSPHADRALAYAFKWACEWGGKVVLFHAVQQPPGTRGMVDLFPEYNPYFERQVAAAWETIRRLAPNASGVQCEVVCEVRHGNPKDEIPRVAEEKGVSLIVTGARGSGNSGAPWGSVSSAVVRDGRLPVLVVRAAPH